MVFRNVVFSVFDTLLVFLSKVSFKNKIFVNFDKEYPNLNKYKKKIFVVGLPQKKIIENSNYNQRKNDNIINFLIINSYHLLISF